MLLYAQWLRAGAGSPTVLILPSHDRSLGSSNLRAFAVGETLERRGWRTVVCPKHLRQNQRARVARIVRPDVILIQKSRHPLNRPGYYPGIPCVFDLDDADFQDEKCLDGLVQCLEGCVSAIAGSAYVAEWCRTHNDDVEIVWTGTTLSPLPVMPQTGRPPVVTWAASAPTGQTHEADFLREVIAEAKRRGGDFVLRFYADDGSETYKRFIESFGALGCEVETRPQMPYDAFLASLNDAAVGLNPLVNETGYSAGKSFGKALAYLERGVPVISHPNADHPAFFTDGANGILAAGVENWASAILDLLGDADKRERIARAGRQSLEQRLSIEASTDRFEKILRAAIAKGPKR